MKQNLKLLFFGADWCPHCRDFKKTFKKLKEFFKADDIEFWHVDLMNPKMKLCIKKAKLVNILCLIDILFAVVYSLYYPIFLISIICSLTGYFGSKKFNYQLTLFYIMYLIFNIIFRVVNFIYVITSINNNDLLFTIISFVVLFLVEFIITYIVISYYKLLKNLLNIEVKYLQTNYDVQKQFICRIVIL